MQPSEYHQRIIEYYRVTENAYADTWDLHNSLSIHYGYRDEKAKSFRQSLQRMNEVMMEAAAISASDHVLDAGCGVGGSSLFIASRSGARVTGITLSPRQAEQAGQHARQKELCSRVNFLVMDYCATSFPDQSFDVIWGCESICYAESKEQFIREAYRLLKPGGRLVLVDGFVTRFENNKDPLVRSWLDGWQVNYLETAERFSGFMKAAGFTGIGFRDISRHVYHSSRRLYRFYYLAKIYRCWRKLSGARAFSEMQQKNTEACKHQFRALQKGRWCYGMITGTRP